MRDRHWKMLMQATSKQFVMDARFCLGDLLALELHNYVDACSEIVDRRGLLGGGLRAGKCKRGAFACVFCALATACRSATMLPRA
jgi:hypothetical protein